MQWKIAGSLALLGLVANAALATPIKIDSAGREWLDLNLTRNRSWNDTAAVCDASSGNCSGVLATTTPFSNDIDISGYHWASRDEVRDLFYEIAGLPPGSLDGYSASFPVGAGHGSAAFEFFDPTIEFDLGFGIEKILNGLTRDVYLGPDLALHGISGIIDSPPLGSDSISLAGGLTTDAREISMGVFLYKTVPEPGTLALFAIGLAGMALLRVRGGRRRHLPAAAN